MDLKEKESLGEEFREIMLGNQINKCQDLVEEILTNLDQEEKSVVYSNIGHSFETLKKLSKDVFAYPKGTNTIFSSFKDLLTAIAEERGYRDKMIRNKNGEMRKEFEKSLFWFKLYSQVILNEPREIRYEYAYRNFKNHRNAMDHEFLSEEAEFHPVKISLVIMLWYTMEDVLKRWKQIVELSEDKIKERTNLLEKEEDDELKYGFIHRIEKYQHDEKDKFIKRGFITSYLEGEDGKSTYFEVDQLKIENKVSVLPSYEELDEDKMIKEITNDGVIGKIVKFKNKDSKNYSSLKQATTTIVEVK